MKIKLILFAFVIYPIFSVNTSIEKKVEMKAKKLLEDIYKHKTENILAIIPEKGLVNSDGRVPKSNIVRDLNDKNSYLYKQLYATPQREEIEQCKKNGSGVFSPFYFYEVNGNNFVVKVGKPFKDAEYYDASFISSQNIDGCKLILFSTGFFYYKNIDKVLLDRYFFE
jgi:hypothetical protein